MRVDVRVSRDVCVIHVCMCAGVCACVCVRLEECMHRVCSQLIRLVSQLHSNGYNARARRLKGGLVSLSRSSWVLGVGFTITSSNPSI